ncbi:MAG: hypothetical protein LBI14_00705 [Treponema sp.]|jgi:hypothetical protein|nr:hypothetical protein [Treponema sp.]
MSIKWLTDLSIDELKRKATELVKPYKKPEINGIAICANQNFGEIEGEVFKNHPKEENIEVSSLGRVRSGEKILPQYIPTDDENLYVDIPSIRTKRREKVYRLVAETWCENPNMDFYNQVHHISNNGYDNRKENLLWVTETQHKKIHPFMKINGFCIQIGPVLSILLCKTSTNEISYIYDGINKLKGDIKETGIKCVGFYQEGKEYDIKAGEYKIYFYDELKFSDEIPTNLISIMQTGNVLHLLKKDIKYRKENIYDFYKDMIENGILKDTVKFNKDKDEFEIDLSFDEKYEKCKKEIVQIIISSLINVIHANR